MTPNPQAHKKLTIARSQLILGHPFFGMLALRLRLVERPSIPTLAVDGKHVFYNPEFILGLSDSLCRSALAHEVMHCVFDHIGRRGARDPKKWNYAGDYAINQTLQDSGFEIGKGWLLHPQYQGMFADQIYVLLPDDPDGGDQSPLDDIMDGEPSEIESNSTDWKIAAIQAATTAKSQGKLSGALQRFMDEVAKPQVDWRDQLRRFVTQISKDDYSWARPNRRYLSAGFYLPSLYSESMGDIVVGIDTSGSIDDKTLQTFGSEIRALTAAVRPAKVHVVYCDAEVNHIDTFDPNDEMKFTAHGGGGTAFKPVFDYVEANQLAPECLVYLTDLYGDHGFASPDYPTLWCCTTDQRASFGDTIRIEV